MIVEGKTIVVTGVGPGLGREVAAAALRDGANVVMGARTESRLKETADALDPSGSRVAFAAADITDEEGCARLMQTGVDRFGGIDAVVQVAALDTLFGTIESTSADDWRRSMEVNVVGTANVVRAAAPHLKARGGGAVVLIGSQSMLLPPPMHQIAYASAKGALRAALRHMASELGPDGIRVNMVIATWMWGPPVQLYVEWQARERGVSKQAVVDEITANMPLGRIPEDGDVAEAALFFCSDRARMVTGETLLVNAGEILP